MGFTVESTRAACSRSRPARTTARRCSSTSTRCSPRRGRTAASASRRTPAAPADRRRSDDGRRRQPRPRPSCRRRWTASSTSAARRSGARAGRHAVLQPTDERRRTGSHYTPRSLTEPIVRHALEPALERLGPDATPAQILELKVCDPAMGSGAFLVEACRQLGARLVEAWARWPDTKPQRSRRTRTRSCTPGGSSRSAASTASTRTRWRSTSPSCRCGSRRLARDHEFTFLDHALKMGDSLVGLTRDADRGAALGRRQAGPAAVPQAGDGRVSAGGRSAAPRIRDAPDDVAARSRRCGTVASRRRLEPIRVDGRRGDRGLLRRATSRRRARRRGSEVESRFTASSRSELGSSCGEAARELRDGRASRPRRSIGRSSSRRCSSARIRASMPSSGNPPFAGKNTIIDGNRGQLS